MIRSIAGGHGDLVHLPDWGEVKEWAKGKLESEKTALVGLVLLTAVLYALVLFSYCRAFEVRTIIGF